MSKDAQVFLGIFVGLLVIALIVWFLTSILAILKESPEPIWFILGIGSCLVIEGLAWGGYRLYKRCFP